MKKNKFKMSIPYLKSLSGFCFISILLINPGCSNNKTEPSASLKKDSVSATIDTTAKDQKNNVSGIHLPSFKISFQYLKDLPKGAPTDKPKLLILTGFDDITNYNTMKFIPYFTKTHGKYAEGATPFTNEVTADSKISEELPKNLVIGNNDIVLKRLFRLSQNCKPCSYFRFVPTKRLIQGDPNYHLAYKIIAVSVTQDKKGVEILTETEIGDTNPCPPAKPSES